MKCPICKTELQDSARKCNICGFTKLHVEFVTVADAERWKKRVVIPYREHWMAQRSSADLAYQEIINKQHSQLRGDKCSQFEVMFDSNGVVITKYNGNSHAVLIPAEINGKPVYKIGDKVFQNCFELTMVDLPNSVRIIGDHAFENCPLAGIDLPNGLTRIGHYAFANTSLGKVCLPHSLRTIGAYAFCNKDKEKVTSLTDIVLGGNERDIGEGAFANTATEELLFPKTLEVIPPKLCENCAKLSTVVVSGSRIISENAFRSCSNLKRVVFSDGVSEIRDGAFEWCDALEKIILPSSTQVIASNAFCRGSFNLFAMNTKPKLQSIAFLGNNTMIHDIYKQDVVKKMPFCQSFSKQSVIFYCNCNSSAYQYAREHGLTVKNLEEFLL